MPIYKCEKCNKDFPQKSHFTQHTKRKTPCVRGTSPTTASNTLVSSPEQSPENSPTLVRLRNEIRRLADEIAPAPDNGEIAP